MLCLQRKTFVLLVFSAILELIITQAPPSVIPLDRTPQPLDAKCLRCICEAASGCTPFSSCALSQDACGPFAITKTYFDLTTTQPVSKSERVKCLKNVDCAGSIVSKYMDIYARDCDADGNINCFDYVRIHIQGPLGCFNATNAAFYKTFVKCFNKK